MLRTARILIVLGLAIGLLSWWRTIEHVGDPAYRLVAEFTKGEYHAWYHAFREALGDVAAMAVILLVFFGPASWRRPSSWWLCLIVMVGYYAPFWIGTPFVPQLAAPNWGAELAHIFMTALPTLGLFLSGKEFVG